MLILFRYRRMPWFVILDSTRLVMIRDAWFFRSRTTYEKETLVDSYNSVWFSVKNFHHLPAIVFFIFWISFAINLKSVLERIVVRMIATEPFRLRLVSTTVFASCNWEKQNRRCWELREKSQHTRSSTSLNRYWRKEFVNLFLIGSECWTFIYHRQTKSTLIDFFFLLVENGKYLCNVNKQTRMWFSSQMHNNHTTAICLENGVFSVNNMYGD